MAQPMLRAAVVCSPDAASVHTLACARAIRGGIAATHVLHALLARTAQQRPRKWLHLACFAAESLPAAPLMPTQAMKSGACGRASPHTGRGRAQRRAPFPSRTLPCRHVCTSVRRLSVKRQCVCILCACGGARRAPAAISSSACIKRTAPPPATSTDRVHLVTPGCSGGCSGS